MSRYDSEQVLYKLTWTIVQSHSHVVTPEDDIDRVPHPEVSLTHKTQTLIVEAVDECDSKNIDELPSYLWPNHGMMFTGWLNMELPQVITQRNKIFWGDFSATDIATRDHLVVVHSIEPYSPPRPAKRSRLSKGVEV